MLFDRRSIIVGGVCSAYLPLRAEVSASPRRDTLWRVSGNVALQVEDYLSTLPTANVGRGPRLFILSSSLCPFCQKMETLYSSGIPGFQARYIAYPLIERESGAVAQVWKDPTYSNYRQFMAGQYRMSPNLPYRIPSNESEFRRIINPTSDIDVYTKHKMKLGAIFHHFAEEENVMGDYGSPTPSFFIKFDNEVWWLRSGLAGIDIVKDLLKKYPDRIR